MFANRISREPLGNRQIHRADGRRLWYLARTRLNVKVKGQGQGHQGQKRAVHCYHPRQRRNGTRSLQSYVMQQLQTYGTIPSLPGVISAACVRFLFGNTSLVSGIFFLFLMPYGTYSFSMLVRLVLLLGEPVLAYLCCVPFKS